MTSLSLKLQGSIWEIVKFMTSSGSCGSKVQADYKFDEYLQDLDQATQKLCERNIF